MDNIPSFQARPPRGVAVIKSGSVRCVSVSQCSTVMPWGRSGLLRLFHLPIRLDPPLPCQLTTPYTRVCSRRILLVYTRLV